MLAEMQDKLWAQNQYALCSLILPGHGCSRQGRHHQARHVGHQSGRVRGPLFKAAFRGELDHDYPVAHLRLPERGRIGIFNRSYYEEVLVVRVHPE